MVWPSVKSQEEIMPGWIAFIGLLLIAAIFLYAGYGKLVAPSSTIGYIAHVGLPLPPEAYVVSLVVELGGGILLVLGWQTRFAAAVLALFCLVTGFAVHLPVRDHNNLIHFYKNLAMAGGLLQIAAFGAGAVSFDARRAGGGAPHALQA
jgi:putative oxidoreductase